jgi:predicted DNA-binding transcriptional regulator
MKHSEMYTNILTAIGLTKDAISVYLFLLRNPNMLPAHIARETKLYRVQVYKAIAELEEKKLILMSSQGKRVTYSAESPTRLEQIFHEIEESFLDTVEDMHKEYNAGGTKPVVSIHGGEQAIRDAYSDMVHTLGKNESYYRYSSVAHFKKSTHVPRGYEVTRDRKGLERFVITGAKNNPHTKRLGRSVKIVPPEYDLFQDGINVLIYKDRVVVIDYVSDTTITIKHKVYAEFQRKLFKLLYSKL